MNDSLPRSRVLRRGRGRNASVLRLRASVEPLEGRLLLSPGTSLLPAYDRLPLSFEANRGQADAQVRFLARGPGYSLFLTPDEAVLSLGTPAPAKGEEATGAVLRMRLVGADAAPRLMGLDQLSGVTNYLVGNDPSRWQTGVANYARVEEQGVYPGVGLTYYGNQRQLEYDFTVAPGADPGVIRLAFEGAESLALDGRGDLVLHTAGGDVVERAPVLYQDIGGVRRAVAGRYVLEDDGQVGFAVGAYDTSRALVIDPTLSYATYLGGNDLDVGQGIAVDAAGNAYVTGFTRSTNFPTAAPEQAALGGPGNYDVFVAKLNPGGTALVYSTYLGGRGEDVGNDIAVDRDGNAYLTGKTSSFDFPTVNPVQSGLTGRGSGGVPDAFVAKLNASGSTLVYSTYLGGGGTDEGGGIAVDAAGAAYVVGRTSSADFPTTPGAFQTTFGGEQDAFVSKLNPGGSALVYSTFLGGDGFDGGGGGFGVGGGIAVDAAGDAYVAGTTFLSTSFPTTATALRPTPPGGFDAFVARLNAAGSALVYSTYLGGGGTDRGADIAVDAAGVATVVGSTLSDDFPTTPGAFQTAFGGVEDAFVSRLNPDGSAFLYSTFLGGPASDGALRVAVDAAGDAYVTGETTSDFPTADPIQPTPGGGVGDAFVSELNAAGSAPVYSTYLGGGGRDLGRGIAVDAAGNAYVVGQTSSADFPRLLEAAQTALGDSSGDAFVAKIAPSQATGTADVELGFTSVPASLTVDEDATLTITVLNLGPDTATDVGLTTAVPDFTDLVSFTAPEGWTVTPLEVGRTLIATAPALAPNGFATFRLVVRATGIPTPLPQITARARVTTRTNDPTAVNDQDVATLPVVPQHKADVAVRLVSPQRDGDRLGYTIRVVNNGPSLAHGVRLTNPLPVGAALIAAPGGVAVLGVVSFKVGTLAPGASRDFPVAVRAATAGALATSARVTAQEDDPAPANNTATLTVPAHAADVSVTLGAPQRVSEVLIYQVFATNDGPSTATGVRVAFRLPDGATFVDTSPGAVFDGGVVTYDVPGGLAKGQFTSFAVFVRPVLGVALTATASVTAQEADPVPANNIATSTTTIPVPPPPSADVEARLASSQWEGDLLSYQVQAFNSGPDVAHGVQLSNRLPDGATLVSAPGAVLGVGVAYFDVGTLEPGSGRFFPVVVRPATAGVLTTTASVTAREDDPAPANNAATLDLFVPVRGADVEARLASSQREGDLLSYQVQAFNSGPDVAHGVQLSNRLPDGATLVSAPGGLVFRGVAYFDVGTLDPGEGRFFPVVVRPATAGVLTATASVTAREDDPAPANNTVTKTVADGGSSPTPSERVFFRRVMAYVGQHGAVPPPIPPRLRRLSGTARGQQRIVARRELILGAFAKLAARNPQRVAFGVRFPQPPASTPIAVRPTNLFTFFPAFRVGVPFGSPVVGP